MDADAKALTAVQVLSGFCYCCAAAVEMVVSVTETTVAATDVTASGSSCFFCAAVVETTAITVDASNLIRSKSDKKGRVPCLFCFAVYHPDLRFVFVSACLVRCCSSFLIAPSAVFIFFFRFRHNSSTSYTRFPSMIKRPMNRFLFVLLYCMYILYFFS